MDDIEKELLRDFYEHWKGLQEAIAKHQPRFVLERKAQGLTEAHHALAAFDEPAKETPKIEIAHG